MKKIILVLNIIGIIVLINACEPRIEMDMTQWGDHAYLDNVQVFKYEVDDDPVLYETMNDVGDISGYRRIISATATIDNENAIATVSLKGNESLTEAGLIFYHQCVKIEPLDDSPRGGMIGDLSNKLLKYRLYSADGTTRDWTIKITQ